MRINSFLIVFFGLIPIFFSAQEYVDIDFSSTNITPGNWNNVVQNSTSQTGMTVNLINSNGAPTGAVLTITDAFNNVNTSGTTAPDATLPFPATATADSFFGNTVSFGGVVEVTGGLEFTGLDPAKYYSFQVFASRMGATNNREGRYTFTGSNTLSANLDASNNTSNMAKIYNIQPNATGKITLSVQKGPNNNDASGFYYLGAMRMIITSSPYSDTPPVASLELIYPNGGEIWHATSTPYISWNSQNLSENVTIQYSTDNGSTWLNLTTVAPTEKKYIWNIPYAVSNQCKVRISSSALTDTSDNPFSIISNTNKRFKIVVLGSSTAAGAGPTSVENAWVWMYTDYLKQQDTRFDVTNLAVGGYTTYKILPTGANVPSGVTIDTERNITKAIALNADGIIVNMPSNDSNMLYSANTQMNNYHTIANVAATANIPIWMCTVQPRNFGTGSAAQNIQNEMVVRIPQEFPTTHIDFWTTLANPDGSINPIYNSGDGVHLNNAAHLILLQRVINKNLHTVVRANDNNLEDVNPTSKNYLIDFNFSSSAHLSNGNWTNMSNVLNAQASNIVDDLGGSSTYSIRISDAFYIGNELGTQAPIGTIPFPISATRDSFVGYTADTGQFTISGLDPNKNYTFTLFASRVGLPTPQPTTDVRTGLYNAQGINSVSVTLDAYNNTSNVAVLPNVKPTDTGNIILNVLKSTTNTNTDGLFYINSLKMTEISPTVPDVLLDCENGTTNRLTVLNPMANGPGQSTADFQVVNNPLVAGINTSSKVVKFTRRTTGADTEPWGGFWCNTINPNPDVTVNKYIHVKILKDRNSQQKFKLENGAAGNLEIFGMNAYTDVGQWQDIVFDFSAKTGTYNTVAFMPDWLDPLAEGADQIIYFDDIVINSNPFPQTMNNEETYFNAKIFVYPNPASKELYVNSQLNIEFIEIYNTTGNIIKKHYINTTSLTKLDVSNLSDGFYFFKFVSSNGSTETKKIIISNN